MSFIGDLFGGGGGGSQTGPATTVTTSGDIAPEIKPFMEEILGESQKQFQTEEFKKFPGPRIADFTAPQKQVFSGIQSLVDAGLGAAPNIGGSAQLAQQAQQALGQATQQTELADIQRLMNPYQQAVIDIQKREAERDFEGGVLPQIGAQAAGSRAFGGSRQAILESEARRNLDQRLADIQATGSQQAYNQALAELGREKARQQAGAGLYGTFAQQFPAQALRELGTLQAVGETQQQRDQRALDIALEDFLREESFPATQLARYAGLVRGFPVTGTTTSQQVSSIPTPSLGQQLLGAGTAITGMLGNLGQAFRASGGQINRLQSGGQIQGGLASLERHRNNINPRVRSEIMRLMEFFSSFRRNPGNATPEQIARIRDAERALIQNRSAMDMAGLGAVTDEVNRVLAGVPQEETVIEEVSEARVQNDRDARADRFKVAIHEKMIEYGLNPNDPQDVAEYIRLNESISETPDFKYPGEIPDPTSAIQRRFNTDRMNRQRWIKENAERTKNLIDDQAGQWSESMGIENLRPRGYGLLGSGEKPRGMLTEKRAEPLIEYMESLKGRRDIPLPVRKPVKIVEEVKERELDEFIPRGPGGRGSRNVTPEDFDAGYEAALSVATEEFEPRGPGEGGELYDKVDITGILEAINNPRGGKQHPLLPKELRGMEDFELRNLMETIRRNRGGKNNKVGRRSVDYRDPRIIRRAMGGNFPGGSYGGQEQTLMSLYGGLPKQSLTPFTSSYEKGLTDLISAGSGIRSDRRARREREDQQLAQLAERRKAQDEKDRQSARRGYNDALMNFGAALMAGNPNVSQDFFSQLGDAATRSDVVGTMSETRGEIDKLHREALDREEARVQNQILREEQRAEQDFSTDLQMLGLKKNEYDMNVAEAAAEAAVTQQEIENKLARDEYNLKKAQDETERERYEFETIGTVMESLTNLTNSQNTLIAANLARTEGGTNTDWIDDEGVIQSEAYVVIPMITDIMSFKAEQLRNDKGVNAVIQDARKYPQVVSKYNDEVNKLKRNILHEDLNMTEQLKLMEGLKDYMHTHGYTAGMGAVKEAMERATKDGEFNSDRFYKLLMTGSGDGPAIFEN
jgi:hypothetical protein